jgi:hypothetical protein
MGKVYHIGVRKVTNSSGTPLVYLGKDFRFLIGKKVILTLEVFEEVEEK